MTHMDFEVELEESPVDDQMDRLEDLLTELMLLTRRYKIALVSTEHGLMFLDLATQHVIGVDLVMHPKDGADPTAIDRYDAQDSILDGVWPVRGPDGTFVEQHVLRSPWPTRER